MGLYGRPWVGIQPVHRRASSSKRTTAADHKGPPFPAPLCSLSSTATTLARLVLRTQQCCKDYPRPYGCSWVSPVGSLHFIKYSTRLSGMSTIKLSAIPELTHHRLQKLCGFRQVTIPLQTRNLYERERSEHFLVAEFY